MDILGLIAFHDATCYTPDIVHGKGVVLWYEHLAVLPQGKFLPGEFLEESNAGLNNVKHFFKIDLLYHRLSCKNFQDRKSFN